MTPTSSQILERRRLAAIGVKAYKSQRLIAQELNVTETTIRRDLEVQGITRNKEANRHQKEASCGLQRQQSCDLG
jgi:IS30 family transposase